MSEAAVGEIGQTHKLDGDPVESMYEAGWSDGLPLVPPTSERVAAAVAASGMAGDVILGRIPPFNAEATIQKVAANAVMAGCRATYMPVVIAAVRAACHPDFDLGGLQATTHNAAPLVIVSGPISSEIGMNWSHNVFGPGNRANATIGRALALVLRNIGGALPGIYDKSTQGHPGKYTYCIAENEPETPWEPFRVQMGFEEDCSTVTVVAAEAPHSCVDLLEDAEVAIDVIADSFCTRGGNKLYFTSGEVVVVLCPEHAMAFSRIDYGWRDLRQAIFERARRPFGEIRTGGVAPHAYYPRWLRLNDETPVPVVQSVEDILLVVSGGPSVCSSTIPGWGGGSSAVTVQVGS